MFLMIVREEHLTIFFSLDIKCLEVLPAGSLSCSLPSLSSSYMFEDYHIVTPFPFLFLKPLEKKKRNISNSTRKILIRCLGPETKA